MKLRFFLGAAALLFAGACGGEGSTDAGIVDAATPTDAGGGDAGGIPTNVRPSKRSDVGGVADSATGRIAIFGGDDGPIVSQIPTPNFLGDTWVFDPAMGWHEVTASGPSARARYAVAYDASGGRMVVFGGRYRAATSGPYTLYNDLWAFDFANETWTMLHDGSGTAPGARYYAALAVDASGTIYVAGGGLNTDALSPQPAGDLWAFSGGTWSQVATSGDAPSARLFEAWAYDSMRNRLVAFGGQVGDFFSPAFGDLYALDLTSGAWSQLAGENAGPAGRFNAMLEYDAANDRYLLIGGHQDPGVANDLWAWDAAAGGWTSLSAGDAWANPGLGCLGNPREIPQTYVTQDLSAPERRQGGVFRIVGGRIYLLLGESDCSDHLDDVWFYDLNAGGWTEVIEARSGESCERRDDDCECLCL